MKLAGVPAWARPARRRSINDDEQLTRYWENVGHAPPDLPENPLARAQWEYTGSKRAKSYVAPELLAETKRLEAAGLSAGCETAPRNVGSRGKINPPKGGKGGQVATATQTRKNGKPKAKATTARKAKQAANAMRVGGISAFYLKRTYKSKREQNRLTKLAQELAEKRGDSMVRLEYIFVAEGRYTVRQLGSAKMQAERKGIVQAKQRASRKSTAKAAKPPAKPTPRKQRVKVS